jgi:hypothetical protein
VWTTLTTGVAAQRVAAIGHGDGRQQVFVLSTAGVVRSLWQNTGRTPLWAPADPFGGGTLPALADIAAGPTTDGRVQVFAVATNGEMRTRTATAKSPTGGWSAWSTWSVARYAPRAATPPALDGAVSLTAGRWLECGRTVTPVVLATDNQGNIYVTTFTGGSWQPWRSFYN